jgi:hypothetical protein
MITSMPRISMANIVAGTQSLLLACFLGAGAV